MRTARNNVCIYRATGTSATIVELNAHIRHVNAGPLPTTRENLGARERRAGIDQVVDQVDDELNQELKVIDDCLTILNDALAQAQQELGRLKETSALLAADLASKAEAEHIDHRTHNLQTGMPSLGLYTSTMVHSPPKTVVPSSWVDNSDANIAHAEQDIASSKALDTHIHLTIEDYYVALSNQVKLTDRAFQARIQEVDDARAQDEANIAATQNEIAAQQANIKNLTASIEAKTQPFQLATTRLNTRDTRRGVERTTDAAHHSLVDEAEALDHAIGLLDQRLAASQSSLHDLISTLAELRSDLALKNDTLIIDRRCTKLRQHSAIANKLKPGSIAY